MSDVTGARPGVYACAALSLVRVVWCSCFAALGGFLESPLLKPPFLLALPALQLHPHFLHWSPSHLSLFPPTPNLKGESKYLYPVPARTLQGIGFKNENIGPAAA